MKLLDLDEVAAAHHGLITLAQSRLSRDAWYRAIRAGSLQQLHPGVARLAGTPRTHHQQIAAAVLEVSDDVLEVRGRTSAPATARTTDPWRRDHRNGVAPVGGLALDGR